VVTSPGNPPLTGSVAFYDGDTLLGTVPLTDGVAVLTIPASPGSHVYRALFSGSDTSSTSATTATVTTDGPQVVGLSRYGYHERSTALVLYFNAPLDPASALNLANYQILNGAGHRIAVKRAVYDPTTQSVTLKPAHKLNVHLTYTLTVIGTRPNGLTDPSGTPLDGAGTGQPGTNFTTKLTWRALTIPGDPAAVTYVNGQAHEYMGGFRNYVQSLLRATRAAIDSVTKPAAENGLASELHRPETAKFDVVKSNTTRKTGPDVKGMIDHEPKPGRRPS
jgi:hypothetical protein